jgi:hypothetical protein
MNSPDFLKPSITTNLDKAYRIKNSGIAKMGHEVKMSIISSEGNITGSAYLVVTSDTL